ncbi:MAG: cohesin domain-containing protein, partial [bacterium]
MKDKIKFLVGAITILLFAVAFTSTTAQPVVTMVYTPANHIPGDVISVPIKVTGTIQSYTFLLKYDRTVLTATSASFDPIMTPGATNFLPNFKYVVGDTVLKLTFLWQGANNVGITLSNETVVTVNFTYLENNAGTTNLNFYKVNTNAAGTRLQIPPLAWILTGTYNPSGGYSVSGLQNITSVTAGGDWATAATWNLGHIPDATNYRVIVNSTASPVTISANTTWPYHLQINAGGKLTLNPGKSLGISGNMNIKSSATGTGSFVDFGTTTVGGTTTVERYTTGNWNGTWPSLSSTIWHYIASPVSGGTINSYLGSLLNHWDEPTSLWVAETLPVTNPLIVNKGYSTATTTNKVITFTGEILNTGDQTIGGLTRTGTGGFSGANLVGNCYPSDFTWNDAYVTRTNVDAAAYFWNGTTYVSYLSTDASFFKIPAEQGYFVFVSSGFTSGSMYLSNGGRDNASSAYLKTSATNQLSLKVNGNSMEDETSIRFNSSATEGFDGEYDALKLWGVIECPQVYSITPETNLSINSLTSVTSQTVIPVGFRAGVADTYTITASGLETFTPGTQIFLEDLVTSQVQNLNTNPVYSFSAVAGNPSQRFNLHFSPVGIAEGKTSDIKIYAASHVVYVNIQTEMSGTITIYDLLGKEITHQPIQSNGLNKVNLNVQTGYYLVRVLGDNATVT